MKSHCVLSPSGCSLAFQPMPFLACTPNVSYMRFMTFSVLLRSATKRGDATMPFSLCSAKNPDSCTSFSPPLFVYWSFCTTPTSGRSCVMMYAQLGSYTSAEIWMLKSPAS